MICYKDMTFCSSDCVQTGCFRHWDNKKQTAANIWWTEDPEGTGAPIAFSDLSSRCEQYKAPKGAANE